MKFSVSCERAKSETLYFFWMKSASGFSWSDSLPLTLFWCLHRHDFLSPLWAYQVFRWACTVSARYLETVTSHRLHQMGNLWIAEIGRLLRRIAEGFPICRLLPPPHGSFRPFYFHGDSTNQGYRIVCSWTAQYSFQAWYVPWWEPYPTCPDRSFWGRATPSFSLASYALMFCDKITNFKAFLTYSEDCRLKQQTRERK